MTEPNTQDHAPTPNPTAQPDPAPAQASETDWKAEARKWEQRAKENTQKVQELQPLADQFRQLDEASKSEMQRLQESLDAAARERDAQAAEALRYRVAIDHGVGKEDLDLLGTGTQDELAARAQRLADLRAQAAAAANAAAATPPTQRTVPDLRPGATPSAPPTGEKDALYAELFGADTTQQ